MMILTVVMFCVSATFFSMDLCLVSDGLFNPREYPYTFINLWGPETATHIICQGINSVLGDSIVIWRAWVVWGRRLPVVLVPVILLVGVGLSSFIMVFAQRHGPNNPNWVTVFMKSMIVLPCLTLATHIVSTTLLLWRVYALTFTTRKVERLEANSAGTYRTVQYRRLLKIIIQSGALYCLTWLLLLGFAASGSPASHILLSIIGQLTGIYPTLIIVLVSLNLTHHHVQGGLVDSGIKFDGGTMPQTTFTRTISFPVARNSHGLGGGSGGSDGVAGEECVVDTTKSQDCPSDPEMKGYGVYQVV